MKRFLLRSRTVLLPFLLAGLLFLTACGAADAPKKAAKALLDACTACDNAAYAAVMGRESVSLTDPEMFILRRMTYRLTDVSFSDSTHACVTAEITVCDMMALLNEAFLYSHALSAEGSAFDPEYFLLQKLNTGEAVSGNFRAGIPLLLTEDGQWTLDPAAEPEELRDAVSGGAYSWWNLYTQYYLTDDPSGEIPA